MQPKVLLVPGLPLGLGFGEILHPDFLVFLR
jgi:hypothetical protein